MLKDVKFKHSYSSGYDEPKEFFTEANIVFRSVEQPKITRNIQA